MSTPASQCLTHLEAVFSTCTGRQGRHRFPPSAFHAQTAPGAPRAYPCTQVRWQGLCPSLREQSQGFVSGGRRSLLTSVAGAAGGETMAWLSRDLTLPAQSRPWMVRHGNKCSCLLSDPCGLAPQCLRITSPTSPPSWPQSQGTIPRSGLAGGPGYASAERTWSEGSFQRPGRGFCLAWSLWQGGLYFPTDGRWRCFPAHSSVTRSRGLSVSCMSLPQAWVTDSLGSSPSGESSSSLFYAAVPSEMPERGM